MLSTFAIQVGRVKEAIGCYHRATELDPLNAECWLEYGETLYEEGRFADSLAALDNALQLDPEWSEIHYGRARTLLAMTRLAEMSSALRTAIKLDPRMREEFVLEFPEAVGLREVQQALSYRD